MDDCDSHVGRDLTLWFAFALGTTPGHSARLLASLQVASHKEAGDDYAATSERFEDERVSRFTAKSASRAPTCSRRVLACARPPAQFQVVLRDACVLCTTGTILSPSLVRFI